MIFKNILVSYSTLNIFYRLFDFSLLSTPRLKKELGQLLNKPPFGMKVNIKEGSTSVLEAGKSVYFVLKKNH